MRTRHSRHGGHHHHGHGHGHGHCGSCGCSPCSCHHNHCDSTNPYMSPIIYDDCTEQCPTDDTPDVDTCQLSWDQDAEAFPTGATGHLSGATRVGNTLVIEKHADGTPVDKFSYRSGVKDLGEICTGAINIALEITAASYRQYFRVATTEAQIFNAPFVFYSGQTVTARYVQTHLEVFS